jgi:uncharacterized damage-inducible protein DinB
MGKPRLLAERPNDRRFRRCRSSTVNAAPRGPWRYRAMSDFTGAVRAHLARVLDWEDAHVNFDRAVDAIPPQMRGVRAEGFAYSPWELLEHLRIAQEDIVDFCTNPAYAHTKDWPDDYWPESTAPPADDAWHASVAAFRRGREELQRIARTADLANMVPTGTSDQTYLRAILLAVDHAAYHVGQLVALRRALGLWRNAAGSGSADS